MLDIRQLDGGALLLLLLLLLQLPQFKTMNAPIL
jgi:hypothetical protein